MPTLGTTEKKSPLAQVAIVATVVGSLAGFGYWVTHRPSATSMEAAVAPDAVPAGAQAVPAAGAPLAMAPSVTPVIPPPTPLNPPRSGPRTVSVTITGPLETAIVGDLGRELGGPLTQVINRSLVWWLKVPGDVLKGDSLTAVYEAREGQEPLVHAVRFTSRKFGKTFEAFRYQAKGEAHAKFFQPDGTTLEEHLTDPPIDDYEQITSLLRDGRKHKGVDFKAPVGTPVRATFDGVIARKNWNFRGNGNSIEIQETGGKGRTALYLHLSEIPKSVKIGERVKRGQAFAKSGNTGHSFAPHLHYQLMIGSTVVDPFESHKTARASLQADDRAGFDTAVARLKALMPVETIAEN
jgi:murein DD-endopeptidase